MKSFSQIVSKNFSVIPGNPKDFYEYCINTCKYLMNDVYSMNDWNARENAIKTVRKEFETNTDKFYPNELKWGSKNFLIFI
jgi:hypothetical protein